MNRAIPPRIGLLVAFLLLFARGSLWGQAGEPQADPGSTQNTKESAASPADSRADRLKQRREEKRNQLEPPQQGAIERYLKEFDRKGNDSVEDLNFRGFHPRLDWIARGSGAALGVRYWKPEAVGPVDVMGSAYYSWRRYQHYDLQLGLIPNRGKRIPPRSFATEDVEQLGAVDQGRFSRFKLYLSGRFRDRTDESFYGTGPDSRSEDRVRYRVKDTLEEVVTGYQFTNRLGWTFKAGFIQHSLSEGRSSPGFGNGDSEEVPGLADPPNYFRLQNSILLDYRDDPGVPHQGFLVAFGWERWNQLGGEDTYNFQRFGLDSRAYIPLGSRQRVLAFRGVFVNEDSASGSQVPFFLQPSLGGGESLRGYEAFRFQGDKLMLLQGEYRWEASRRIELALFGDTGTVANQGERISLDKLKSDWGVGLRFKSSRSTLFRVDQAWGNEGARTEFRFAAVF